jgi:hypothetical protein
MDNKRKINEDEGNEGNKKTKTSSPESNEKIADILERLAQQGHREALLLSGTNKTLYKHSRSGTTQKALDQIKRENIPLIEAEREAQRERKLTSLQIGDRVRDIRTGNTGTIVRKYIYNWRFMGPEELTDDYVEVEFIREVVFKDGTKYNEMRYRRYSTDGPIDGNAPPYDRYASDVTRYDILDLFKIESESSRGGKSKRKINKSKKRKTIRSLK